jgi:hypothetical protein
LDGRLRSDAGLFYFYIRSRLAKLSKRKIEAYYTALGRFVTVWAEVEQYLDLLMIVMAKPDLPHQLSKKIATVRRKLKASHSPHASAILKLVDDIEALSDTRHDYIHGSIIGHKVTRSNLTITLATFLQPRKKPRRKPTKVTAEQITDTTAQLYKIGGELLELVAAIHAELRSAGYVPEAS